MLLQEHKLLALKFQDNFNGSNESVGHGVCGVIDEKNTSVKSDGSHR
jgi:hypothetical protein